MTKFRYAILCASLFVGSWGQANGLYTVTNTKGTHAIRGFGSSISGASNNLLVSQAVATHFMVTTPARAAVGSPFFFTVTPLDQFNNTANGYSGTVDFTSTDSAATLPANSTIFSGGQSFFATLRTTGNQIITVTDTLNTGITGTSNAVAVSFAATDLAIGKSIFAPVKGTGLPANYGITVNNLGPAQATAVTVIDVLPAGTTLVSATPSQGTCSGTTTVTCDLGTVINGGSPTIVLVVTLPTTPGPVSNTATVSSSNPDPNPANNSSTVTINVISAASIPALSPFVILLLAVELSLIAAMRIEK